MICCLYSADTNALLGVSENDIETQSGQLKAWLPRTLPDFSVEVWNPALLCFTTKSNTSISKREFLKRLTPSEYSTIKAAAAANGQVDYFWQMFMLSEAIVLDNPDTVAGMMALESLGLLSVGRADEILK